jgi:transglutaminase-like putative cysteine protease
LAASIVETHPRPRDLHSTQAVWPLNLDQAPLEILDFLAMRGPVRSTPALAPLIDALQPRLGLPLAALLTRVSRYITEHFEYAPRVTHASSPIDDVLAAGKGVCQDFAHLMIAVLRSFAVPARYVSGYIHRPGKESQSHAWCEAWLPDLGWIGIDPTHDHVVNDHFVKVAIGRDFTDVPPNKGVYRGQAGESIFVRVETRALDRLPPLSWREQLPPLQAPMTAIQSRSPTSVQTEEQSQQQQQ